VRTPYPQAAAILVLTAGAAQSGLPEITAIMAWVARMESQRRSERTRAGLAWRKAEGLPVGREPGAKDASPRKRSGYLARWERERQAAR
jgi:DNA invertase Pin-like site-specific DNA recombinase